MQLADRINVWDRTHYWDIGHKIINTAHRSSLGSALLFLPSQEWLQGGGCRPLGVLWKRQSPVPFLLFLTRVPGVTWTQLSEGVRPGSGWGLPRAQPPLWGVVTFRLGKGPVASGWRERVKGSPRAEGVRLPSDRGVMQASSTSFRIKTDKQCPHSRKGLVSDREASCGEEKGWSGGGVAEPRGAPRGVAGAPWTPQSPWGPGLSSQQTEESSPRGKCTRNFVLMSI